MSRELMEMGYEALTDAQRRAPKEGPDFEIIDGDRLFRRPPAGFGLIAQPLSTTIKYGLPILGAAAAATAAGKLQKAAFPQSQNPVAPLLAGIGGYVLSRKASQKTSDITLKNIYKGMKKVGL
jgi:hypothetical protein